MQFSITNKQNISKNCLVCGVDNDFGLQAKFYETSNEEVIGIFTPHDQLQSYPNVLHGGISATILDETIGRAIMAKYGQNSFGVTIELNIKYKKSVPLNCELKAIGRITKDKGRIFEGTGELILPSGEIAVTATAKYMKQNLEKIVQKEFLAAEWFASDAKDMQTIEVGK